MRTVCDLHTCLPLEQGADADALSAHLAAGASFVSVNVGMDFTPLRESVALLQSFRERLGERRDRYEIGNGICGETAIVCTASRSTPSTRAPRRYALPTSGISTAAAGGSLRRPCPSSSRLDGPRADTDLNEAPDERLTHVQHCLRDRRHRHAVVVSAARCLGADVSKSRTGAFELVSMRRPR